MGAAGIRAFVVLVVAVGIGCSERSPTSAPTRIAVPQEVRTRHRPLAELVVEDDALRGFIEPLIAEGAVDVVVVPPEPAGSSAALERLQITTHSSLGALVFLTGGLVVEHGWLRIVGGPTETFPYDPWSLATELGLAGDDPTRADLLVVAIDRLGGLFVLDGGVLGRPGKIAYFAPDTLEWEPLDLTHSGLVEAMLSASEREFYRESRWVGWETEVEGLAPLHGISVVPPLWAAESRPLERASRRPVPLFEMVRLGFDVSRQLRERIPESRLRED